MDEQLKNLPEDRGAHNVPQEHTRCHGAIDTFLVCLQIAGRNVSREEIEKALQIGDADA